MGFYEVYHENLWYLVKENPCRENPIVALILTEAKHSGFTQPVTPARWATFKRRVRALNSVEIPWRDAMLALIERVDNKEFTGKGDSDWRYTTNRKGHGNSSVAGALFSMLHQSANYGKF